MPSSGTSTGLHEPIQQIFNLDLPVDDWAKEEGIADEEMRERIIKRRRRGRRRQGAARFAPDIMRQVEKAVLLQTLDHLWREHLVTLDHLRQVIGFRGYAQRDPLNEYKTEAFELFQAMLDKPPRGGDRRSSCASRSSSARRRSPRRATSRRWRRPTSIRSPARTRWRSPTTTAGSRRRSARNGRLAARRRSTRNEPGDLGQGPAQRPLPLRLRQEVQALPRPPRLSQTGRTRS